MANIAKVRNSINDRSLVGTDTEVADQMNNVNIKQITATEVSEKFILANYGDNTAEADAILTKIETIGQSVSMVGRITALLKNGDWVNLGDARTRTAIDELVSGAALTADEGDKLKALAESDTSIANLDGLGIVTAHHVSLARA